VRRMKALIPLLVLFMLFAVTPVLAEPSVKEPFQAYSTATSTGDPTRYWTAGLWTTHLRGLVATADMTGDINGVLELTENANMNAMAGQMNVQIKGAIYVDNVKAYSVSVNAKMTSQMTSEGLSGTFVFQGVGSYKGIHITGTVSAGPTSIVAIWTGTKLTTRP